MRHQQRRQFLKTSGTVTAIGLSGIAGCLGSGGSGSVNVGWVVPGENIPSYFAVDSLRDEVAEEAGNSYDLTLTQIGSTPEVVSAIAAGELDLGLVAYASFPRAILNEAVPSGLTGVAIDFNDANPDHYSFTIRVMEDSEIRDVSDLDGMNIGVNAMGTGVQAIIYNQLEKAGLDPENDVTWVELAFPAMGSALEEGRIDAGIFPSVFATAMRQGGGTRVLFDSRDSWGREYPFAFYAASNDALENNAAAIEGYLSDHVSLIEYMQDDSNRDTIISALVDEYDMPRGLLESYLLTEHDVYRPPSGEIAVDPLQSVTDRLSELGFADESVSVGDHTDNSYLP